MFASLVAYGAGLISLVLLYRVATADSRGPRGAAKGVLDTDTGSVSIPNAANDGGRKRGCCGH